MKMVLIAYNVAVEVELMQVLRELTIENFTKWPKTQGRGATSGPHLDSHIWPAANSVMAIAIEDDKAKTLLDKIRELRKTLGKEGIKAFSWNLEEVT